MDSYDEYAPPAVFSGSGTGVAPSSAGQVSELKKTQEARPVLNQQIEGDQASDSASTAINASMVTNPDGSIFMGRVLLAIPYIHCYKVQTGGREGTCVATAVSQHSHMPWHLLARAGLWTTFTQWCGRCRWSRATPPCLTMCIPPSGKLQHAAITLRLTG